MALKKWDYIFLAFLIVFPFAHAWKAFLPDIAPLTSDTNIVAFTKEAQNLQDGFTTPHWNNTWWLGYGNNSADIRFPNIQDLALMFIDPVTYTKFRIQVFQAIAGVSSYILGWYMFKESFPSLILGFGWMAMGTIWTNILGGHDGKLFALAVAPWVFFGLWMNIKANECTSSSSS